jgi:tetratricopeptide (TPR) repeat protein
LQAWAAELRDSPPKTAALERAMTADFTATSPSGNLKPRRKNDGALQVWQKEYKDGPPLGREAFLVEWHSAMRVFSVLYTVEFQIVAIRAESPQAPAPGAKISASTRARYEFVGTGTGFHREQWVGHLDLDWEFAAGEDPRLRTWRNVDESRCRSLAPIFEDQASEAFGQCASFGSQFLPGVDHWRTLLDGASGIDIYGHNGVAAGDIDGDGFDDLYICQPAGLPNCLYRNRGDGTFEDVTEASGTGLLDNTACALFADVDNDGRQDLIVVRASGPLLFLNAGKGKFRLQPNAFQFANPPQGTFTGAAIADYDRDGWLDIYFCLYSYYQGADQYRYPAPYYAAENGPPNFLMKNNRNASFRDATQESGLDQNNKRFSFCCGWSDFDGDGWPDLYVVNDFGRKNLYRNNGDGTFTDVAKDAGVEDVGAGMSISWLDYDMDGCQDLYVADMWTAAGLRISMQEQFQKNAGEEVRGLYRRHAMGNCLYRNQADGKFSDAGAQSGALMGRWAWSSDSWDMDHDGYPELYIANGMISGPLRQDLNSFFWRQVVANSPEGAKPGAAYELGWNAVNELIREDVTWSGCERNVLYLNNGDGTFSDASGATGLDFPEDSRTFALADFDGDGSVEMVLKSRSAPQLRYLKNVMPQLAPSISFRLTGKKSNRDAIGTQVIVETSMGRQTRLVQAGSGFLAQHSKELFFGLGAATGNIRATIRWPSGLLQNIADLPANHRIWIEEGSAAIRKEAFAWRPAVGGQKSRANPPAHEPSPAQVETWLLVPVAAPDFQANGSSVNPGMLAGLRGRTVLLYFGSVKMPDWEKQLEELRGAQDAGGSRVIAVNVEDEASVRPSTQAAVSAASVVPVVHGSPDLVGIYNLLYGRLFDRHRNMGLPTVFLLDSKGDIVKIYQGPLQAQQVLEDARHVPKTDAERLQRALPFPGVNTTYEFGRNYLSFGAVFYERDYLSQSEAYFRLAAKDDPNGAEALYGLGSVYLKQNKNAEAREYFERASRAEARYPGTLPNTWNNLGILAAREGKTDEAIGYFQKALQFNPDNAVALQNLGNAYRQKKDWPNAKSALGRSLALNPDDPEANYGLGMVYAQNDDTGRAYDYLQRALAARPAYPEALNNLAILYLRTQHPQEAQKSFEESIRVAPEYEQSYLNLARLYAIQGDKPNARATLERLLKIHPDQPQAVKELQSLSQ